MDIQPSGRQAQANGSLVDYDDLGTGETALLLLPGWCESRRVFTPLAERLALSHRVLALDLPGHGRSAAPSGTLDFEALVAAALAVVSASGARRILPLAHSHAGWAAIELRRRLGERVAGLLLLDWIVLPPPAPFLAALAGLQDPDQWQAVRDRLLALWRGDGRSEAVRRHLEQDMGRQPAALWMAAGRSIAGAYAAEGHPLAALGRLRPPPRTLHLYGPPADAEWLAAQQDFARGHPWFAVSRLAATSHMPMLELPDAVAAAVAGFAAEVAG